MHATGLRFVSLLLAAVGATATLAADNAPWGKGKAQDTEYAPQRAVYDVAVADSAALSRVLDRVSYLNNIYQADPFATSIVLVLHGDEIPLFAIENYAQHKELMTRAQSLTVGGTIKFRMCQVAARGHGFAPGDIHAFVEIVPMADAEIVRLQREEDYAYMR